ncbi:MAG: hypothetical protein ABW168_06765, partial [Sedimenticola sp.]
LRVKKLDAAMEQAKNYATLFGREATFAVATNGHEWRVQRKLDEGWVTVPDLPHFSEDEYDTDWPSILLAIDQVSPSLAWLDRDVPARSAENFFGALQRFFYARNELTVPLDGNLTWAADNLLRVLSSIHLHPNYVGGKMSECCHGLNKFWATRGKNSDLQGTSTEEMVRDCKRYGFRFLDERPDPSTLNTMLLRLMRALLVYSGDILRPKRPKYQPVTADIQRELRALLSALLAIRFDAPLPDPLDKVSVGDIQRMCQPAWQRFVRGDH